MLINQDKYFEIMQAVKRQIGDSRTKAILSANKELVLLYWNIGHIILQNQAWGNKFIETLAHDIKLEFPNATGFSVRNLKYMAKFAQEYSDFEIVQTLSAQLSWSHNIALMDKVKDTNQRLWYSKKCVQNAWSLNVLKHQIELDLYARQALAEKSHNFNSVLQNPQSELATDTLKDPYVFDFITMREDMLERDVEAELIKNVTKLLLELGTGFAFLGNQYHLEIGDEDFYLDLLFYNLTLRCYVVIELKTGKFQPEYAGKLNFYLSAVDHILKRDGDNPSVGILLCKEKNAVVAEYALRDMTKPIGISEYKLTGALPISLEKVLPSVEDIENRIKTKEIL